MIKSIKSFKKVLEKDGPKVPHAVIEVEIDTTRKYLDEVEDAFTNARRISKVMTRHTSAEVDASSIEVRIRKKRCHKARQPGAYICYITCITLF